MTKQAQELVNDMLDSVHTKSVFNMEVSLTLKINDGDNKYQQDVVFDPEMKITKNILWGEFLRAKQMIETKKGHS